MLKQDKTTEKKVTVLLYDATCRFCDASSHLALKIVPAGTVEREDINDPQLQARYGISLAATQREMHVVTSNGVVTHGGEAVRQLLKLSRWLWPLALFWYVPGFAWLAQKIYLLIADHRYLFLGRLHPENSTSDPTQAGCDNGACAVHLGLKKT